MMRSPDMLSNYFDNVTLLAIETIFIAKWLCFDVHRQSESEMPNG
jgi:hypothetical protein